MSTSVGPAGDHTPPPHSEIRDRGLLDGPGRKYIRPAVAGSRVFVPSCTGGPDTGRLPGASHLEGWDLVHR